MRVFIENWFAYNLSFPALLSMIGEIYIFYSINENLLSFSLGHLVYMYLHLYQNETEGFDESLTHLHSNPSPSLNKFEKTANLYTKDDFQPLILWLYV